MISDTDRLLESVIQPRSFQHNDVISNENIQEQNFIAGVFVVDFHCIKGYVIEWCFPGDINFEGIEYKCLISGGHSVDKDFVYFRHLNYYGVGYFCKKVDEDNQSGRGGVQMKTVGLLCTTYDVLENYISFLENATRNLMLNPENYDRLIAFYIDHQKQQNNNQSIPFQIIGLDDIDINCTDTKFNIDLLIDTWGLKLFSLWKMILLRRRILFISSPPIGHICQLVQLCHRIGYHSIKQWQYLRHKVLFNISLFDTNSSSIILSGNQAYLACSADQILLQKPDLFDCSIVLSSTNSNSTKFHNIDFQFPTSSSNPLSLDGIPNYQLEKFICPTKSDRSKLDRLLSIRDNFDSLNNNWTECAINFFQSENENLLHSLLDISQCPNSIVTAQTIECIGFDSHEDRNFLLAILELYGIDVVLQIDSICC